MSALNWLFCVNMSFSSIYDLKSDLKVVVWAVSHTVSSSHNILGSYQGAATEMSVFIHQWNHPGIFIFLAKKTKSMFANLYFLSTHGSRRTTEYSEALAFSLLSTTTFWRKNKIISRIQPHSGLTHQRLFWKYLSPSGHHQPLKRYCYLHSLVI